MEISLTTPAVLFPAISLLLLAYTNRFLALANLVRSLHNDYKEGKRTENTIQQIHNLRRRINYIRYMQGLGVFSFSLCVVCMYCIYNGWMHWASYVFAASLLSLLASLIISLIEIIVSTNAIGLELSGMENTEEKHVFSNLLNRNKGGEEKG